MSTTASHNWRITDAFRQISTNSFLIKRLANLNYRDGDDVERYLQAAIKGFSAFKDYPNLITSYLRMCEIKLDLKDYKGAKIYADKADECCRTNKENYFLGD